MLCNFFSSMWHSSYNWLDFSSASPTGISDQLLQFDNMEGFSRLRRLYMTLIWLVCTWVL